MPVNTLPAWTRQGDVSNDGSTGMNQLVTAAANDYTGIDADYSLCFTADPTNGSFVRYIRFKPGGTNVASVARIFFNNGSTPGTAANNQFFDEVSLPATTAIATSATVAIEVPMNLWLNPGFRIYWGLGTAVAAGWVASVIAGKY